MATNVITLYSMLTELATWISTSQDLLEKAKSSGITTKNNSRLKSLVSEWTSGVYDEDPEILHSSLIGLIP
jgi:hypothetical protein